MTHNATALRELAAVMEKYGMSLPFYVFHEHGLNMEIAAMDWDVVIIDDSWQGEITPQDLIEKADQLDAERSGE